MDNTPDPLDTSMSRQRRLGEAAKLVPVLAAVLMLVPVLLVAGSATSSALIYVFTVWAILILLSVFLSRALTRSLRAGGLKDAPPKD